MRIYYNEYAFAGDGSKIAKAIASLPESQRNDVNFVMEQVKQSQGFLADNLTDKINPNIISMMEGVGLLDGITVNSDFGKAELVHRKFQQMFLIMQSYC